MNLEFQTGDYFSGVLLATCRDEKISRPRVQPLEHFPAEMRVEFPRKLREEHPIGTRFRATVKVAQKHNSNGSLRGGPYLVATKSSIQLETEYSPMRQIYAIPIGDRLFEYVDETTLTGKPALLTLRDQAYEIAVDEVPSSRSETVTRKRNPLIRSYALERSIGVCEGCDKPAPFTTRNGKPYLEVHHIVPVSNGGGDHPLNIAALCPNCHRRTEKSQDGDEFNEKLRLKIIEIEGRIG